MSKASNDEADLRQPHSFATLPGNARHQGGGTGGALPALVAVALSDSDRSVASQRRAGGQMLLSLASASVASLTTPSC